MGFFVYSRPHIVGKLFVDFDMIMKVISLLFFLSFINAQIALPTFQAVHKPQNTSGDCNGTPENPLGSSGLTTSNTNVGWS